MEFFLPIAAMAAALFRVAALPRPRLNWFISYLLVTALTGVVFWIEAGLKNQNYYGYTWYGVEYINTLLWLAIALELYSRVANLYPGMSRTPWAAAALLTAMGVMLATIIEPHKGLLGHIFLLRRASSTVLAIAIGLLAFLFRFFRNSLPLNLVRHAAIMAFYFMTQAAPYFAINLTGKTVSWGKVSIYGAVASYLLWALLLTREGEHRPSVTRTKSDDELRMVESQLDAAMNIATSAGRRNTRD